MGERSAELMPAFRNGFADAVASARELGTILDREVIANLKRMGDEWDKLSRVMKADFAELLGGKLSPNADTEHTGSPITLLRRFIELGREQNKTGERFSVNPLYSILAKIYAANEVADYDAMLAWAEQERERLREAKTKKPKPQPAPRQMTQSDPDEAMSAGISEQEEALKKSGQPNRSMPSANALQRIGLFSGATDITRRTMDAQLDELRRIHRELQSLNLEIRVE